MSDTIGYLEYTIPIGVISDNNTKLIMSGTTGLVYQVTGSSVRVENTYTWVIADPTASFTYLGPRLQNPKNVRNVYAYVSSRTNCVINIYYGAIGSTTTLLSSNLTVTTSEQTTSTFTTPSLTAGTWLMLRIVSKTDNPGMITVNITLTPL